MKRKVILIVLDSVGIGALDDAAAYGDAGADTLGHIINTCRPPLPHLMALGLGNIDGAGFPGAVRTPGWLLWQAARGFCGQGYDDGTLGDRRRACLPGRSPLFQTDSRRN